MTAGMLYGVILGAVAVAAIVATIFQPDSAVTIFGFAGVIVTGLFSAIQNTAAAVKVAEAAVKVQEVADVAGVQSTKVEAMAQDISETKEVSKASHVLMNSNYEIQLTLVAELARYKASVEKTPETEAAANHAEAALAEHREKQKEADSIAPRSGFGTMPSGTPGALKAPAANAEKVEVVITGDDVTVTQAEKPKESK